MKAGIGEIQVFFFPLLLAVPRYYLPPTHCWKTLPKSILRDFWPLRHVKRVMSWQKIFEKNSYLWKNFRFLHEISDFLKKFRLLEKNQIFGWNIKKSEIFRFSENFKIFGKISDFRKIFRFSENFQIFRKFSDILEKF